MHPDACGQRTAAWRASHRTGYNYADQHGSHGKLASVTDASSLVSGVLLVPNDTPAEHNPPTWFSQEEFVANAVMSQREFTAERGQTTIAMDSSSAPEMAAAASMWVHAACQRFV